MNLVSHIKPIFDTQIIIVINKKTDCVHNYTSTYAKKQGYSWAQKTGMNMFQNQ